MMARRRIYIARKKDGVLWCLHLYASEHTDEELNVRKISEFARYSHTVVEIALEMLQEEGLCTKYESKNPLMSANEYDLTCYRITQHGIDYVESFSNDYYSKIENEVESSKPKSSSSGETNDDGRTINSIVEWEPIPLERKGVQFEEAVRSTEDALRIIEGSNGYAESDPVERKQIVWTVRSGLEALKDGFPTKSQVRVGLIEPLRYLAKKFAESAIGNAAKTAISALIELIK